MQLQAYKLSEISEVNPSKYKGNLNVSGVGFIPMSYVDDVLGQVIKIDTVSYKKVSKGYTSFINTDVVFAKITPCMENGKCAVIKNLPNGVGFGSTEFYVIRPQNDIFSEYIWHYLRQEKIRKSAVKHFTGSSGHKRVPKDFIENLDIPVPIKNNKPDIDEQKRIANKLTALFVEIDKAIEKTQKQQKTLGDLITSYYTKTFEHNPHCVLKAYLLSSLIDYRNGLWKGKKAPFKLAKVVRATEFNNDGTCNLETAKELEVEIKQLQTRKLEPNYILLERSGGGENKPVGRVIYIPEDVKNGVYSFSNFTTCLIPKVNLVSPKYLFHFLYFFYISGKTNLLQKAVIGIRNLEFNNYLAVKVPIPIKDNCPNIVMQNKIAKDIDLFREQVVELEKKTKKELDELIKLKQSLLNQAFEGKL